MLASADQGILGRLDESANFRYLMALGVLLSPAKAGSWK